MSRLRESLTFRLVKVCQKYKCLKIDKNHVFCEVCGINVNYRENKISSSINDHIKSKFHLDKSENKLVQPSIQNTLKNVFSESEKKQFLF